MKTIKFLAALVTFLFLPGCGGGGSTPATTSTTNFSSYSSSLPSGTLTLKVSPVDVNNVVSVYPLGNLNPPGHIIPSDHIYLYHNDLTGKYPVYAPADGVVEFVIHPQNDYKIYVDATKTFSYYLDHVILTASLKAGDSVYAGEILGTTSTQSGAVDLGVVNADLTLSFSNPSRYPYQTLHTDAPLKYFNEPLKTQLYAKVTRQSIDKDGKIDFDVAGKLVGNWYLQGLAADPQSSGGQGGWDKQIAFVYDPIYPAKIRISIGGVLSMTGVYGVQDTANDPANVSVSSGKVSYQLYGFDPNNKGQNSPGQQGLLIVQMTDDNTVKVETFKGSADATAEFDSGAQTYVR